MLLVDLSSFVQIDCLQNFVPNLFVTEEIRPSYCLTSRQAHYNTLPGQRSNDGVKRSPIIRPMAYQNLNFKT